MKIEVFDERKCLLGEGPSSRNENNSLVTWVDILGHQVLWRDIYTSEVGSFRTLGEVGFALPRGGGGTVMGVADEIVLRESNGNENSMLSCNASKNAPTGIKVRWNDAKVAPGGELFAGSMACDGAAGAGALYKISENHCESTELLSPVSISNGLDWNVARDQFCFIDTLSYGLDIFDYSREGISNRRRLVHFDPDLGFPDGMCIDAEDGLWVAFFGGQKINRYSLERRLTQSVDVPVKHVPSCCFAGKDLEMLILTTAETGDEDSTLAGMTLFTYPGVRGQRTREFT